MTNKPDNRERRGLEHRAGLLESNAPVRNGQLRYGYANTSIWNIWRTMRQRCENPNSKDYRYYGALEVRVCERWLSFLGFLSDMGDRPHGLTLDRIDPHGNYEKANCRWATRLEQYHNRRKPQRKRA